VQAVAKTMLLDLSCQGMWVSGAGAGAGTGTGTGMPFFEIRVWECYGSLHKHTYMKII